METEEIITSHDELIKLIKERAIFYFCMSFALNKGLRNVMKEHKEAKFSFGDYEVELDFKQGCFIIIHKEYFARIIHAYIDNCIYIGDDEEFVINDLLTELEKEFPNENKNQRELQAV